MTNKEVYPMKFTKMQGAGNDFIVIDTPPMGIVSDALVVAPKTDGVLIVVKDKSTLHSDFENLLDSIKLTGVRTLGAILNASSAEETYSHYKSVY